MEKLKRQCEDIVVRTQDRRAVAIACCSIDHARRVHALLGPSAVLVTSADAFEEREFELDEFTSGRAKYLVFVSIVSEGFDHPPIDCVVLLRPTRSACLYVQTVGRGLRTSPGKTELLVLDYGHVVSNCGPLDRPFVRQGHGRPSIPTTPLDIRIVHCKGCGEFYFPEAGTYPPCPRCQHDNAPKVRKLKINGKADTSSSLYASSEMQYVALPWAWFRVDGVTFDIEPAFLNVFYQCGQYRIKQRFQIPAASVHSVYAMGMWARLKTTFRTHFGTPEHTTGPEIIRLIEAKRIKERPELVYAVPGLDHKHGEVRELSGRVPLDAVTAPRLVSHQLALDTRPGDGRNGS